MREQTYTKITDEAHSMTVSVSFVSYGNSGNKSTVSIMRDLFAFVL